MVSPSAAGLPRLSWKKGHIRSDLHNCRIELLIYIHNYNFSISGELLFSYLSAGFLNMTFNHTVHSSVCCPVTICETEFLLTVG